MPPAALMRTLGPTFLANRATSSKVAPPLEKPVEVLMKSAPASVTSLHMVTFSSSVSRQVSMMTFNTSAPQAAFRALISLST